MSLLELTITAGPTRGQRVRVNESPAAFGRDPGNPLVIDLPTVSRVHGELHRAGDDWELHNLSPNGTRVNGKRVTTKPRTLQHGDRIVVGDEEVMSVALRAGGEAEAPGAAEGGAGAAEAGPGGRPGAAGGVAEGRGRKKPRMSARAKLWTTIFGFWVVVFVVAYLLVGGENGVTQAGGPDVERLSDEQIAAAIREPLEKQEPNERNAVEWLNRAELYYQTTVADERNVFRAYNAYRTALSYAIGNDFTDDRDPWGGQARSDLALAQRRHIDLQRRLTAEVQERYKDAYGKLKSRRYAAAQDAFRGLMTYYDAPDNAIFRNAQRQRDAARRLGEG